MTRRSAAITPVSRVFVPDVREWKGESRPQEKSPRLVTSFTTRGAPVSSTVYFLLSPALVTRRVTWPRQESNLHAHGQPDLSRSRLPIPPRGRHYSSRHASLRTEGVEPPGIPGLNRARLPFRHVRAHLPLPMRCHRSQHVIKQVRMPHPSRSEEWVHDDPNFMQLSSRTSRHQRKKRPGGFKPPGPGKARNNLLCAG